MVKTVEIAEAQAAYRLGVDEEQLAQELIILERNGEPVAAIIPFREYVNSPPGGSNARKPGALRRNEPPFTR